MNAAEGPRDPARSDDCSQSTSRADIGFGALDRRTRAILDELETDPRMPFAQIGRAVGLSATTVRDRIARMTNNGILRIVVMSASADRPITRRAVVGLQCRGDIVRVARDLAQIEAIDRVTVTTGPFDVMVEIAYLDNEHLLEVVNRHIRTIPGVMATDTAVELRRVK